MIYKDTINTLQHMWGDAERNFLCGSPINIYLLISLVCQVSRFINQPSEGASGTWLLCLYFSGALYLFFPQHCVLQRPQKKKAAVSLFFSVLQPEWLSKLKLINTAANLPRYFSYCFSLETGSG